MEIVLLIVGAILGVALQEATSLTRSFRVGFKYRHVNGDYTHDDGVVTIRNKGLRNEFLTDGRQADPTTNWTGSFHFDDMHMNVGRGAYRHVSRENDWGYHYISLLENEDISVVWENMSAGKHTTGSLIWRKKRA